MAAYDILILSTHPDIFQKEFYIWIVGSYLIENSDIFKKQHASRIFEIHLFAGKTESLTWRASNQQVYLGQISSRKIYNASQLNGVGKIVSCLNYGSLINL